MTAETLAIDPKIASALMGVSTATVTTVLLKKGLRNVWLRNTRPLAPGLPRLVGRAFTLRFVPAREDLATPASWASPILHPRTQKRGVAGLTFVGWQEPIDCGGVAVFPNDVIVVDQDGAVLIPAAALLEDVVAACVEQERLETWIMSRVDEGAALPGLYPPNAENLERYRSWVEGQGEKP